jgi:hypothetical protein
MRKKWFFLDTLVLAWGIFSCQEETLPKKDYTAASAENSVVTGEAIIDKNAVLREIPRSFLGLSQEWPHVADFTLPPVKAMIRELASYDNGPLNVRIGGASADDWTFVPNATTWKHLQELERDLKVNYILGLNLRAYEEDPQLAKKQLREAYRQLPAASLLSFEIGNEPNYFEGRQQKPKGWLGMPYMEDFRQIVEDIIGDPACAPCRSARFAGPVWGHVFLDGPKLEWFLKYFGHHLNLATIHYYLATKEKTEAEAKKEGTTPAEWMLNDKRHEEPMRFIDQQVDEVNAFNLAQKGKNNLSVRIAESNSLSNGGLLSVSDAFASALWTLDNTFELVLHGTSGVNYHQGSAAYGFYGKTGTGPQDVVMKPCLYGLLMFQQAAAGPGAKLLRSEWLKAPPGIKVWAVSQNKQYRIVILNKNAKRSARLKLVLNGDASLRGKLARLLSRSSLLTATEGITLAGVNYLTEDGRPAGEAQYEEVTGHKDASAQQVTYEVEMPAASAALLFL